MPWSRFVCICAPEVVLGFASGFKPMVHPGIAKVLSVKELVQLVLLIVG